MPVVLASVKETLKKSTLSSLEKSLETIGILNKSFDEHFSVSSLSQKRTSYIAAAAGSNNDITKNESLSNAISTTLDAAYSMISDLNTYEMYITLNIPKMEDGNNFGVTIQLNAIKFIKETKEKLEKGIDELSKYNAARADVLDKCNLPSPSSKTVTSTTSTSSSEGNEKDPKEGDKATSKTSKSTSNEEKTTTTATEDGPVIALRKQAVYDVDVLYYSKARNLYQTAMTGYMGSIDFIDKNKDKITKPTGNREPGAVYSSMY